jgi:hypothetical protein
MPDWLNRERTAKRPVGPERSASAAAHGDDRLVGLQRAVGNRAVQKLVSVQRDARADADRSNRFVTALSRDDLDAADAVLQGGSQDWMVARLQSLSVDQLRRLDDAMRRARHYNTLGYRMVAAVGALKAQASGRASATAKPGAAYGVIHGEAEQITHGRLVPGGANTAASYRFAITFAPDPAVVHSTQVEFVQVAKVVSTTASAADPVGQQVPVNAGKNGTNRQTADHSRVDRVTGRALGWMGRNDANGIQPGRLRPWTPGSTQPAYMNDTPSRSVPNVDFHFETAAISRLGPDAGTVYATIVWGFTVDAKMQIVEKDPIYFNKESKDFDLALAFWNAEAASSGGAQQPLPDALL